jgi:hypothetical protein
MDRSTDVAILSFELSDLSSVFQRVICTAVVVVGLDPTYIPQLHTSFERCVIERRYGKGAGQGYQGDKSLKTHFDGKM